MKLYIAQINPTVGAVQHNLVRILDAIAEAKKAGADLVVFPELCLSGAPLHDLLFHRDFVDQCEQALQKIAAASTGTTVIVGSPASDGRSVFDAAIVCCDGKEIGRQHDICWLWKVAGRTIAVIVGEGTSDDLKEPVALIVHLAASPWSLEERDARERSVTARAKNAHCPYLFVNLVGGNDGWIFDGNSFYCDGEGQIRFRGEAFAESVGMVDDAAAPPPARSPMEEIHRALILGMTDYFKKQNVRRAVVGLSGGIDSSLTATLAVEALGSDNVLGVLLPSKFTSADSTTGAKALCRNLGINTHTLPIEPLVQASKETLIRSGIVVEGLTDENLQSRIRSILMMAITNAEGSLLLGTGNKSEVALGYATLYGDLAGALLPLGDLFKTQVYELAAHLNAKKEVIPASILHRPPTAELHSNQRDSDDLPPYDQLDNALKMLVMEGASPSDVVAKTGMGLPVVQQLVDKMMRFEFKRRQGPCILRVSSKAFGTEILYPIVNQYRP